MTFEELFAVDRAGMYSLLKNFPAQVREAVEIGRAAHLPSRMAGIRQIVLCGLGGSAIGGDLLKSALARDLGVPFSVNRTYTLPASVGPGTLVIVSSYSGNTEETNAAHREALRKKAKILCITSGGNTRRLAVKHRSPLISIPPGLPPRAALGYSFFPLLIALGRIGFVPERRRDIRETLAVLDRLARTYSNPDPEANAALQLAGRLRGRVGVIYSSAERFDAVNTRWRGQLAENGKSLAFGHVLPEMNHNELVGWKALTLPMSEMQVIFLRDRGDHPRIALRMELTRGVIARYTDHVEDVWSEGESPLARIFSLVVMGDWVSYYLAILNKQNPTPVKAIEYLKGELAKS